MIDLLQLECLTGLEEAKRLAENPIVQVRNNNVPLVSLIFFTLVDIINERLPPSPPRHPYMWIL